MHERNIGLLHWFLLLFLSAKTFSGYASCQPFNLVKKWYNPFVSRQGDCQYRPTMALIVWKVRQHCYQRQLAVSASHIVRVFNNNNNNNKLCLRIITGKNIVGRPFVRSFGWWFVGCCLLTCLCYSSCF